MVGTRVMGRVPRPCSPMSVRSRSRSRAIVTGPAADDPQTSTSPRGRRRDGVVVDGEGPHDGRGLGASREVYGAEVSRETISKITDAILAEMTDWLVRPVDRVYPVILIDAIHVK